MKAAGYTLDLYCDADGCGNSAQFFSELGVDCRHEARHRGWSISALRDLCPLHSGKSDLGPARKASYLGVIDEHWEVRR